MKSSYDGKKKEVIAFVKKNINDMTYKKMSEEINERFNLKTSVYAIQDLCTKRLKIHRNKNTGRFSTSKVRELKEKPIGSETTYKQGNKWIDYVKVNNDYIDGEKPMERFYRQWVPKRKYIYEKYKGKVPDGWIVIFVDGTKNYAIDNLAIVNRAVLLGLNANGWIQGFRQLTSTAIDYLLLNQAIKENKQ